MKAFGGYCVFEVGDFEGEVATLGEVKGKLAEVEVGLEVEVALVAGFGMGTRTGSHGRDYKGFKSIQTHGF